MVGTASISGGSRIFATPRESQALTPHEHQAALQALGKLKTAGSVSHGIASVLGGSLRSAISNTNLVGSQSQHTFAGGIKSDVKLAVSAVGSDTVVSGSAFTKAELTGTGVGVSALTPDTIKAAGVTAASVKHDPAEAAKSASHTITLSDKTSITLSGISTHDVIKPH